jgi:hypothetical protein
MERLRVVRLLRIVASTICIAICLLLIAAWVRSYWWDDGAFLQVRKQLVRVNSGPNGVTIYAVEDPRGWIGPRTSSLKVTPGWQFDARVDGEPVRSVLGFRWFTSSNIVLITAPYWSFVLPSAALAVACVKWSGRFSLRAMMIATMLISALLGTAIYLSN